MSADPRPDRTPTEKTLARFSVLIADATLLINRSSRPETMIDSLLNALQLFKENRLGGIQLEETAGVSDDPLTMTVAAFFSIERFKAANVPHHQHRQRILSALTNEGSYTYPPSQLPHTVKDVIDLGHERLRRRRHLGKKTIEVMYTLFKHENLL